MGDKQLISESGVFNIDNLKELQSYADVQSDFQVVGIIGPQSSGKSTLLNAVFGTQFPTMDRALGRVRCTRGVKFVFQENPNYLVLDIEGTDSRERGESGDGFEAQTSLFALSVCDVIILNMWMHDLGRYKASGMSLLNNIAHLHLKLFNTERKTAISVCVRDYDGSISALQVREMLETDLCKVVKDHIGENGKLLDVFDLTICLFPNVCGPARAVEEAVAEFRNKIISANYTNMYGLTITELPSYMNTLWTTICNRDELKLPEHKVMVAKFKTAALFEQFRKFTVTDDIEIELQAEISRFKHATEHYHQPTIYDEFLAYCELHLFQEVSQVIVERRTKSTELIVPPGASLKQLQTLFREALEDCQNDVRAEVGLVTKNIIDAVPVPDLAAQFQALYESNLKTVADETFVSQSADMREKVTLQVCSTLTQRYGASRWIVDLVTTKHRALSQAYDAIWQKGDELIAEAQEASRGLFEVLSAAEVEEIAAHAVVASFVAGLESVYGTLDLHVKESFSQRFNTDTVGFPIMWCNEPKEFLHNHYSAIKESVRQQFSEFREYPKTSKFADSDANAKWAAAVTCLDQTRPFEDQWECCLTYIQDLFRAAQLQQTHRSYGGSDFWKWLCLALLFKELLGFSYSYPVSLLNFLLLLGLLYMTFKANLLAILKAWLANSDYLAYFEALPAQPSDKPKSE